MTALDNIGVSPATLLSLHARTSHRECDGGDVRIADADWSETHPPTPAAAIIPTKLPHATLIPSNIIA